MTRDQLLTWAAGAAAVVVLVQSVLLMIVMRRHRKLQWEIGQRRGETRMELVRRVITSRAPVVGALQDVPTMVSVDDAAKAVSDWLGGRR